MGIWVETPRGHKREVSGRDYNYPQRDEDGIDWVDVKKEGRCRVLKPLELAEYQAEMTRKKEEFIKAIGAEGEQVEKRDSFQEMIDSLKG